MQNCGQWLDPNRMALRLQKTEAFETIRFKRSFCASKTHPGLDFIQCLGNCWRIGVPSEPHPVSAGSIRSVAATTSLVTVAILGAKGGVSAAPFGSSKYTPTSSNQKAPS